MYSALANKLGYVRKGETKVKLSRNFDDQLKAAKVKGKGKEKIKAPLSKDGVEWEGEDDYHVGRVWPQENEQSKKAILYVRLFPLILATTDVVASFSVTIRWTQSTSL